MNHGPITFEAFAPTITLDRESRTIRGEITAFGVPTTDYRKIVLHEGSLRPRLPLSRVKMLIDHDQRQPVGFMTELKSDNRTAAFKVPEGDAGDKALQDAANGLRDGLSVGINVLKEEGAFMYDEATGTYHVYAAELVEVSLCAIPAYEDAGVTSVAASRQTTPPNKKENTVDPETLTQEALDAALAAHAETFDRTLETRLANFHPASAAPAGPSWPSMGAFMKDLVSGDTLAAEFYETLAYGGATTADDKAPNKWVRDAIHLVNKNRKVLNAFSTETLPADGMNLEYLQLKSNSISVAKQAKEGDDLAKGKVQLQSKTAAIGTFGGWTELTKQIIERASAAYINTANTAMDLEYARATEQEVRDLLKTIIAGQLAGADHPLTIASNADAYAWLDLVVDASMLFDDRGFSLDGSFVSVDVFKKLIRLEDSNGNSLMRVWGNGTNQVGELDLRKVSGDLASVTVELLPGAEPNTMEFHDAIGITTWESAGAPFKLQSENVVNLTEAFSKYGYLATASQFPDAIQAVKIGA